MLACQSFAKVNLTLDVLSRRPDGYHDLSSVVHTIGLYDTLVFEFGGPPGVALKCNVLALESDSNLVVRAALAWLDAARKADRVPDTGIQVELRKRIPSGAGLGGGSSNAAATLIALQLHFGAPPDASRLYPLAAKLGADVPFFLTGGCTLMEGIGEFIMPLPTLAGWLVLIKPPQGLSTPEVYRRWDALGRPSQKATTAMLDAVPTGVLENVARALGNDLTYAARDLCPEIGRNLELLRRHGALGAEMTGSGSAVFGLFHEEAEALAAAQAVAGQLGYVLVAHRADNASGAAVFVVPFSSPDDEPDEEFARAAFGVQ